MNEPESRDTLKNWWGICMIVLAGLAVYANCYQGEFIFDDSGAIVGNPYIRHLWPLIDALKAPARSTTTGRPTICLTMALNYALFGMNVAGYRAVNLAIHLLSALALFGIVRRTLAGSAAVSANLKRCANGLGCAAGLLFAVHPLQSIAVNYITQRTESVMALFYLATFYFAVRGWQSVQRTPWFCAAVVSCAFGMGSKEVMVSVPLMVLAYDRIFNGGSFKEIVRRSWLLYLGLASTWLILAAMLIFGNNREGSQWGRLPYSGFEYALTEGGVILYYLRLSLWPYPLCFDYGWPIERTLGGALPGLVGMAILGIATIRALVRTPELGFLGLIFFAALAPSSSFVPLPDAAVEYRMYLPMAALSVLYVVLAFCAAEKLATILFAAEMKEKRLRVMCLAGLAVWAGVFAVMTFLRNADYHSEVAIWSDVARKRPEHARGHASVGIALATRAKRELAQGQSAPALEDLKRAANELELAQKLKPDLENIHKNLGSALAMLGRNGEALQHLQAAVASDPSSATDWFNLGNLLSILHKNNEAADAYTRALEIDPNFRDAHYNFGVDLFERGNFAGALSHFAEALRIDPQSAEAHYMSAVVLAKTGHREESERHKRAALEINPQIVPH